MPAIGGDIGDGFAAGAYEWENESLSHTHHAVVKTDTSQNDLAIAADRKPERPFLVR